MALCDGDGLDEVVFHDNSRASAIGRLKPPASFEIQSQRDPKETVEVKTVGAGIAIGTAIGVGIGVAMGNIGVGIAIGIAIGAAIGASRQEKSN